MLYCKHPNKLAQLRQNAHLSQKQLAQKLGVSQASINYWENGQRTPSVKAAQKISDYFKMPISEIFSPYKEEINITNIVNAAEKFATSRKTNDDISSIIFTSKEYSMQELQSIQNYASFLKSQRNLK